MNRSKEFDDILETCLELMLVKGKSIDHCLETFPRYAAELKPLLEVALATRKASAIEPRAEFRERARYQFYAAMRDGKRRKSPAFLRWQPHWVPALAIVVAVLVAASGTVAAACSSMPDQPLYTVKLATEQVELAFKTSPADKVEFYTAMAENRVDELVRMADENKTEHVELVTQRIETYWNKMADLSGGTADSTGPALVPKITEKRPNGRTIPPERRAKLKQFREEQAEKTRRETLP